MIPEMAAYDPDDAPRGFLTRSQLLAIAGGSIGAWVAVFGLGCWLLLG